MRRIIAAAAAALMVSGSAAYGQSRVGPDSATRLTRFGRDLAYGAAMGLGYAAVDQANNNPSEWGHGWNGYGKRAASNIGEFVIQEGVTEGLAAVMNRPLDYTPCTCRDFNGRVAWAIAGAVTDQMPNGSRPLAIPRIVGAYVGSFAQMSWWPSGTTNRTQKALINGTTSLAFGAVINMYHEFRHH